MGTLRTCAFVLVLLCGPVSCSDVFFTDPVICYFLDGFLMIYCIVATALFFREKFSRVPPTDKKEQIYQELEKSEETDKYEILERDKRKKQGGKQKAKKNHRQQKDKDLYETLPTAPPSDFP